MAVFKLFFTGKKNLPKNALQHLTHFLILRLAKKMNKKGVILWRLKKHLLRAKLLQKQSLQQKLKRNSLTIS